MPSRSELPDLYEVLEISASATFDEIEEAYGKIRETLVGGGLALYSIMEEDEAGTWREQVEMAYRTLSDPERRRAYDRHLRGESDYPPLLVSETHAESSSTHDTRRREEMPMSARPAPEERSAAGQTPEHATVSGESNPYAGEEPPPLLEPAAERVVAARPRRRRLYPSDEIEITADTEFSGTLLRRLRESAGAELTDVAEITKVGKGYLRAIEANDFDALPAAVYVRGFVVEYAKVLGLDSDQVASSFMALFERYRNGGR